MWKTEKYLQSQINGVEDEAVKVSVKEQMHITAIHTLKHDFISGSLSLSVD